MKDKIFPLVLCLLLAGSLSACQQIKEKLHPDEEEAESTEESSSEDSMSEADRTRAMEEKAAELDRRAEEIRNMEGTEQEKIDAVNELERERQELNRMGGN
jgi:erythromycin esterase-like protein